MKKRIASLFGGRCAVLLFAQEPIARELGHFHDVQNVTLSLMQAPVASVVLMQRT